MDLNTQNILENIDLNNEAPEQEPERQYYFMKKLQLWYQKESERLGRPLFFKTVTFGCQMNTELRNVKAS